MNYAKQFSYEVSKGLPERGAKIVIEDQSLTVAQHLQRINGGIMPTGHVMEYPEDENEVQIRINDLTDLDVIKAQIDEIDQNIEKSKKAAQEAAKAAQEAAKADPNTPPE